MDHRFKLLSKYLKESRTKSGMSQVELAKKLGYNAQFISNWERGLSSPPAKIMNKLVKVLSLSEKELLDIIMTEQKAYWSSYIKGKNKA